jgi:hypothetical protein
MNDDNLRASSERALVVVIVGTISLVAFLSFLGSSASLEEVGQRAIPSERIRNAPVVPNLPGQQEEILMPDQGQKNPDQRLPQQRQAGRNTEIQKDVENDRIDPDNRQGQQNAEYGGRG